MTIQDTQDHIEEELSERLTKLPLTDRFFGKLARMRLELGEFCRSPIWGWVCSEKLENRLQRIQNAGVVQSIVDEVGNPKHPGEFDRRLLNAWAEIRVLDQLLRERFVDIHKVTVAADFEARRDDRLYAIQVTRVNRDPKFADGPVGTIEDIYGEAEEDIGNYLWDSIRRKNARFETAYNSGHLRRITVVTSTQSLQDPLNRHIACRQIRDSILIFEQRNFEELQWLLDNGNGAILWVEADDGNERVRCLCDWSDDPSSSHWGDYLNCHWQEVDLDSEIPHYVK